MRVLLSTIGSRGEVQPMLGLALELKALGQEVRLVAPPDFREWVEGLGIPAVPIGPEVRSTATASAPVMSGPPSPELLRRIAHETVATQFNTITEAGRGCDVLVAGGALMFAVHSIAEALRAHYVYASFCPQTLPSADHVPPPHRGRPAPTPGADNRTLWAQDAEQQNERFLPAINEHRARVDLAPLKDLRSHLFTDHPWLASDAALGPAATPIQGSVLQTGAWILPDREPLSPELEAFLAAGEPPVFFGFGSMRAPQDLGQAVVGAARALGRRAIVSKGWAGVTLADAGRDCLSLGDVNHQALFPRCAAIVHHGGAGTTTTIARAGVPQVVVPQMYDQHYWARRVGELGIGVALAPGVPTGDALEGALRRALQPDTIERARALAPSVRGDGARVAAERLLSLVA